MGDTELNRVIREIKMLDSQIKQSAIRNHTSSVALPAISRLIDDLVTSNELDLTDGDVRDQLRSFLEDIKSHAPVVHIGLAHEASADEIAPIVDWMRTELNPVALVHVGIQPEIIGGCTVRTSNKFYDFSLRQHLDTSRESLLKKVLAL